MKRSASITSHFIVLALATSLLINSIAFTAYATGRPPPATPVLTPNLPILTPHLFLPNLFITSHADPNPVVGTGSATDFHISVINIGQGSSLAATLTALLPPSRSPTA